MSSPASPEPAKSSLCKICKEEIKPEAIKCIHCDSFQDWRGSLNFSGTVLSLLVALVSVLGVVVPVLKDTFTPKNSDLVVSAPYLVWSYDNNTSVTAPSILRIVITNTGVRTGWVNSANIEIHFNKDVITNTLEEPRDWMSEPRVNFGKASLGKNLDWGLSLDEDAPLIPPGTAHVIKLSSLTASWSDLPESNRVLPLPADVLPDPRNCQLNVVTTDFNGEQKTHRLKLSCSDIMQWWSVSSPKMRLSH